MIQLLIVSAVRFYREGLAAVLAESPEIAGCGAARDAAEAWAGGQAQPPDVVLVDAALPGARGLVECWARVPGVRVIAMAVGEGDEDLVEWAAAGVAGFVGRDGSVEELVEAVTAAARGELHCSPSMTAGLLRHLASLATAVRGTHGGAPAVRLTEREHEVVQLIAGGLSNKGIARRLGIEVATAKNHVHNILRKLQVEDRDGAAEWLRLHAPPPGPAAGVGEPALAGAGAGRALAGAMDPR